LTPDLSFPCTPCASTPAQKRASAARISAQFGQNLKDFYGGRVQEVLQHPRYRLHIATSRGCRLLAREHGLRAAPVAPQPIPTIPPLLFLVSFRRRRSTLIVPVRR